MVKKTKKAVAKAPAAPRKKSLATLKREMTRVEERLAKLRDEVAQLELNESISVPAAENPFAEDGPVCFINSSPVPQEEKCGGTWSGIWFPLAVAIGILAYLCYSCYTN